MSAAWGFAEATLFFLVPDVWLTWIALDRPRLAWRACLWALAGAVPGGVLMYLWGARDAEAAREVLDRVPAITRPMCDVVAGQLRDHGAPALFLGPITGTPYKIYAVHAGAADISLPVFLLVSVPARLVRFLLVTGLVILACRLAARLSLAGRRALHVMLWSAFYTWYFWLS